MAYDALNLLYIYFICLYLWLMLEYPLYVNIYNMSYKGIYIST